MIPAQSIALAQVARDTIDASRSADDLIVGIHPAEESTAIAIARRGELMLARSLELGFSMLREAYLRAIQDEDTSYAERFLAATRRLMETEGVPSPKSQSDDAMTIFQTARPFLQRLCIELKQTIRFTLGEEELDDATIRLTGPGAAIPRFADMLSEEVGFRSVRTIEPARRPTEPGFGIATSLACDESALSISPPGLVESNERSSRRAAILYGAVGAALLLAGDAAYVHHTAGVVDDRVATLERQIDEWNERAQAGLGIGAPTMASSLETIIASDSALRADWGVILAEVVATRPDDIWLTGVSGERDRAGSVLTLEAIASSSDPGVDPHDRIARFVETLQSSPLIAEASLGSTEQINVHDAPGLRFAVRLGLHEVSAPWLNAEVTP